MPEALLALGGNVGDVRTTFDGALAMLCDGEAARLVARSSDYATPPWGVEDQPPFVNCCARWGPRTLDIDLLAYGDVAINDPELTLPHPRLFERAFVLVPLNEIAPDHVIGGVRVRDALAALDATGIERLPPR